MSVSERLVSYSPHDWLNSYVCVTVEGSDTAATLRDSNTVLGSLSSDVIERRTSTGNGLFALLSRNFDQIFGQIVSIRVETLCNTNMVASRLVKREKGSLPVDVRRSKTSLLKLPNYCALIRRRSIQKVYSVCGADYVGMA